MRFKEPGTRGQAELGGTMALFPGTAFPNEHYQVSAMYNVCILHALSHLNFMTIYEQVPHCLFYKG